MSVMPYGKNQGVDIEDVPTDYLQWFIEKTNAPAIGNKHRDTYMNLISEIESELESREKYGYKP